MRFTARQLLIGAAVCAFLFTAILVSVYHTARGRWLDNAALEGFLSTLDTSREIRFADAIARICDPLPFAMLASVAIAIGLVRSSPRRAAAAATLLLGSAATTQILKPLLAKVRFDGHVVGFDHIVDPVISAPAFPSGHATAAMALTLAALIVVPRAWRPLVAAGGVLFALAVGMSIVALAWHYPSDIVGGYLVAATWCLVILAVMRAVDARWPEPGTFRAKARNGAPAVREALAPAAAIVTAAATGVVLARLDRITGFA